MRSLIERMKFDTEHTGVCIPEGDDAGFYKFSPETGVVRYETASAKNGERVEDETLFWKVVETLYYYFNEKYFEVLCRGKIGSVSLPRCKEIDRNYG